MTLNIQTIRRAFANRFPDSGEPAVARSPGKINLLGQHIDHQGGYVNPIAINKYIYVAITKRRDSLVRCANIDTSFADVTYDLRQFQPAATNLDWMEYVKTSPAESLPTGEQHWGRYLLASILYFHRCLPSLQALTGYNIFVAGNVPLASGLSSSSALVVATGLALRAVNEWRHPYRKLPQYFGESECFVGTLSGYGDQTAMLTARERHVAHIMFYPIRVLRYVPFPDDYAILMCPSGERAEKSRTVRQQFNFKVASYHLGRLWLNQHLPESKRINLKCLRHLLPTTARASLLSLYELLMHLPERITAAEIREALEHDADTVEHLLASCSDIQQPFDLRGVCLFGLAEMARSRRFIRKLAVRDMNDVMHIMNISQNGDRLFIYNPRDRIHEPYRIEYSDDVLMTFSRQANATDPAQRRQAQLWRQPGRYGCSTRLLDEIAGILQAEVTETGAHLASGGLGGAMIVICKRTDIDKVSSCLERQFYSPHSLPVMVEEFTPSAPASILEK